jgi:hypothetical protein
MFRYEACFVYGGLRRMWGGIAIVNEHIRCFGVSCVKLLAQDGDEDAEADD